VQIAHAYGFRAGTTMTTFNNWGAYDYTGGTSMICDLTLGTSATSDAGGVP
jgi:hypothetical protein